MFFFLGGGLGGGLPSYGLDFFFQLITLVTTEHESMINDFLILKKMICKYDNMTTPPSTPISVTYI